MIERCRSMVSPRRTDPRRAQTPQGKSLSFLLLQFGNGDQNSGVLDCLEAVPRSRHDQQITAATYPGLIARPESDTPL